MQVNGGFGQQNPPSYYGNSGDKTCAALAAIQEESDPQSQANSGIGTLKNDLPKCVCRKYDQAVMTQRQSTEEIEQLLKEKEIELRAEYDKILEKERAWMKERFNFILSNEQTRACYMLREAHRERKEKITVLQTQLECKNLAALMYVMCTERRRSKLEKLRLASEYTKYIRELQDILTEGQELILHLSRGYKTAARVDHEWREKMKKVISEFMNFIYHFAGGSPESNQYFFDLQNLLKTEAPTEDDPNEDPCDPEEDDTEIPDFEIAHEKTWWEDLESDRRPFIMYGDMSEFNPTERRSVLKRVKAAKTAPKKWKSYVFNDVVFKPHCENLDDIKDTYLDKVPVPNRTFECMLLTPEPNGEKSISRQQSLAARERREHQNTADVRHKMGSILKIMTAQSPVTKLDPTNTTKTALLGARDSMEIASTTKLARISIKPEESEAMNAPVRVIEQHEVLAVGRRRVSAFDSEINPESDETAKPAQRSGDDEEDERISLHASMKNDSLEVIGTHVPDVDHTIYYERVCPIEKCQRMQVDSFMRSLPAYMRAHPFTHFSHTFEGYETCTPEQLDILKQRIESKKAKEVEDAEAGEEDPLREWTKRGVAVQTSDLDVLLPPCTCHVPSPTPVSSNFVFNIDDLMPVKEAMDAIHKECLFDDKIDFNRFKVVGSESETSQVSSKSEFKPVKIDEIKRILVENPSLLDVFNPDSGAPQMT